MAEERRRRDSSTPGSSHSASSSANLAYMPFIAMENFFDKLKTLNYVSDFYNEIRLKPISKHFFALQTNPGEQFFMFTALAAWLIRKCGRKFDTPQEFDDPNSTIANILDVLKDMGIAVDFPPNRLKQGYGEHVIFVLDNLADIALKRVNFIFKRPFNTPETNDDDEDDIVDESGPDENSELLGDEVEEMIEEDFNDSDNEDDDDDDETDLLDLEGLKNLSTGKISNEEKKRFEKPEAIMQSNVDLGEWRIEVERVIPQLKVTLRTDTKDWRSHLELIHQYRKDIDESLSTTKTQLDKLYSDISRTLEKINSREKYLNSQLEQLVLEYRGAQDNLAQVKEQYNSVSGGITERSAILNQITEELDQIKQEMDERGSNMTDGKPLVNIRKALSKIRTELSQMDVRIGVSSHTLLQARLKEKNNMQRAANVLSHSTFL